MSDDEGSDSGGVGEWLSGILRGVAKRVQNTGVTRWLLLRGDRTHVTLALLLGVFVAFLALALVRPVDMERLLSETTTLRTLFQALLSGAILIVSVVSSISSIVLSQEITDIETEEERIDTSIELILYTIYEESRELGAVAARSDDRPGARVDGGGHAANRGCRRGGRLDEPGGSDPLRAHLRGRA
jgi:hypothetical protein